MKTLTNKRNTIQVKISDELWIKYEQKAKESYRNATQTIEQKTKELVLTHAMQVLEHREHRVINEDFTPEIDRDKIIAQMEHNHLVNYLMDELVNKGYKLSDIMRLWNGSYMPETLKNDARIITQQWIDENNFKPLFSDDEINEEIKKVENDKIEMNKFHFRYADSEMDVIRI